MFLCSARAQKKHIREYLKDEGHKDLLLRYDADQKEKAEKEKEAEKAKAENQEAKEGAGGPSPRKLRTREPKTTEVSGSHLKKKLCC